MSHNGTCLRIEVGVERWRSPWPVCCLRSGRIFPGRLPGGLEAWSFRNSCPWWQRTGQRWRQRWQRGVYSIRPLLKNKWSVLWRLSKTFLHKSPAKVKDAPKFEFVCWVYIFTRFVRALRALPCSLWLPMRRMHTWFSWKHFCAGLDRYMLVWPDLCKRKCPYAAGSSNFM